MSTSAELNKFLFAALERLDVENMTPEQIEAEATRAEAIVQVADRITENTKATLQAAKLYAEHGDKILKHLPQIGKPTE
jgi:chitodextrinase